MCIRDRYKTKIVKLLYLIDVEYYRTYQQTLTGLEWIYYYYGPYAYALERGLEDLGFLLTKESFRTQDGKQGMAYKASGPQDLDDLGFAKKAKIDRIIKHWAFEDTEDLLDFVYTDTEPMRGAVFGEMLDFSKIEIDRARYVRELSIPQEKLTALRERFRTRQLTRHEPLTPSPRYDAVFFEGMGILDSEDEDLLLPASSVTIPSDVLQALLNQTE